MTELDSEVRELLDRWAANPATPVSELTAEAVREHDLAVLDLQREPGELYSVEDVEAPGPAGTLPVRVYRPRPGAGARGLSPATRTTTSTAGGEDDEDAEEDDDVSLEEERLVEDDRVHLAPSPWEEDDERWLPKELEEEQRFHLREERSGVALASVEIEVLAAPVEGSVEPARYRVTIVGRLEDPPLLLARARWRRYL